MVSVLIAGIVYMCYMMTHFGGGYVMVPDWYDQESLQPFPVMEAVHYWNKNGINLAIRTGIITFALTFTTLLVYPKLTKEDESTKET